MKCDSDKIEHKSATERLQLVVRSLSWPHLKLLSALVLLNGLWPFSGTLGLGLCCEGYLKVRALRQTRAECLHIVRLTVMTPRQWGRHGAECYCLRRPPPESMTWQIN